MIYSKVRGNEIYFDESGIWRYTEDNSVCYSNWKEKPCGHCGKSYTEEGHDGCLGNLIGVMNACCGHGEIDECYVQFLDGECLRGKDAKIILDVLKKYRKDKKYHES